MDRHSIVLRIATAFAQPDHDLSYQNVTFAERDNVIVGMVLGYTAEQPNRLAIPGLTFYRMIKVL